MKKYLTIILLLLLSLSVGAQTPTRKTAKLNVSDTLDVTGADVIGLYHQTALADGAAQAATAPDFVGQLAIRQDTKQLLCGTGTNPGDWVTLVGSSGGAISVLTDNGDGTYSHSDGVGTVTVIDIDSQTTLADATAQAATAPDFVGQLAIRLDTKEIACGTGTNPGDWQIFVDNDTDTNSISVLTDNGDGTFSHNDGDGTIVTYRVGGDVTANADGTVTVADAPGDSVTFQPELTPDQRIAALNPIRWFTADPNHLTYDSDTSEIVSLTDRGSLGVDLAADPTFKAHYQSGYRGDTRRIRMYDSKFVGGGSGVTKSVFHVGSADRFTGGRQTFFRSQPISLEYYSNNEMRVWYDPNPGGEVYSQTARPRPGQPFIFSGWTGFVDGGYGWGGHSGHGFPEKVVASAIGQGNSLFLGESNTAGRRMKGSFFEHIEFDRVLTEAEFIDVQLALAEKWKLWSFQKQYRTEWPVRIAHRCGLDNGNPENAISSALRSIQYGIDGWEVDIHRTADGTPWLMHDSTVDRTTDGTGTVLSKTDAQMQALILNGTVSEAPPSLEQFLTAVKDTGLSVMLNVKDPTTYTSSNTAVTNSGFDRKHLMTLLPITSRANWVSTFPEGIHFSLNDALPADLNAARAFIAARKAEGMHGTLIEFSALQDWHLWAAKIEGFEWWFHKYRSSPSDRNMGTSGYIDFVEHLFDN